MPMTREQLRMRKLEYELDSQRIGRARGMAAALLLGAAMWVGIIALTTWILR